MGLDLFGLDTWWEWWLVICSVITCVLFIVLCLCLCQKACKAKFKERRDQKTKDKSAKGAPVYSAAYYNKRRRSTLKWLEENPWQKHYGTSTDKGGNVMDAAYGSDPELSDTLVDGTEDESTLYTGASR